MNETIMILGGDLFSLLISQVLNKLGMKIIWVSCRQSQQSNYGRELDQALLHSNSLKKYLDYLCPQLSDQLKISNLPKSITIIEDARLINFLDNGSIVDVRIKVNNKVENYKCGHLISTNRYFGLHKKLGLIYEPTDFGHQLMKTRISRCHLMGEVTHLYFQEDQIESWFEELNRFIKIMKMRTGSIPNRQQYLKGLMSPSS